MVLIIALEATNGLAALFSLLFGSKIVKWYDNVQFAHCMKRKKRDRMYTRWIENDFLPFQPHHFFYHNIMSINDTKQR